MRLLHIYLKNYRVLNDFRLIFNERDTRETEYTLDLLVGVNGTGKSTLLRAIAEIFQRLAIGSHFNFGFEISYMRNATTKVFISNRQDLSRFRLKINEEEEKLLVEGEQIPQIYLPELIITFTTGSEKEWELIDVGINQPGSAEEKIINEVSSPKKPLDEEVIRAMYLTELPGLPANVSEKEENNKKFVVLANNYLFIKTRYLALVTLCGLLTDTINLGGSNFRSRLREALDEAKIAGLQGFSLKFRILNGVTDEDDISFIKKLAEYATHSIRQGTDYLVVYDLTQEDHIERVRNFLNSSDTNLNLFRKLVSLYDPHDDEPTLREVNLFLQRTLEKIDDTQDDNAPLHLLEWLSDGEQSFLGRLCLFSLLDDTEALILLDEPEVHFNDVWKREIVRMLDEMLRDQDSHVLLTTHSSITLTDVSKENILVLQRGDTYTQEALTPTMETLAADPSDIITGVFGASQATGAQGLERIKNGIFRALKRSSIDEQERLLRRLSHEIAPGYWSFLVLHQIDEVMNRRRTQQQKRENHDT